MYSKHGWRILWMKIPAKLFLLSVTKSFWNAIPSWKKKPLIPSLRNGCEKRIPAKGRRSGDYAIIYNTLKKDTSNSELEAVQHIYRQLRGADAPDDETARGIIDKLFFL